MDEPVIERICTVATVDDGDEPLEDARKRAQKGDEDMAEWLHQLDGGDACVVQTRTTATIRRGDETRDVGVDNHGIWVEAADHPAVTARQIQETMGKDLGPLARALSDEGVDVTAEQLGDMLIVVELSPGLLDRLHSRRRAAEPAAPRVAEHD